MNPSDRTAQAVLRQLRALRVSEVEVGIRDQATGRMLNRTWAAGELERPEVLGWLKAQNAKDADIYVRPKGSQGIVLVDDLVLGTLSRLKAEGLGAAVIVQTSPMNYQAWVRLSEDPIPANLATNAAKRLAKTYGGDPGSADWRHYGRLAGFTNRKPKHRDERGRAPFVLVYEASGKTAPRGGEFLQEVLAEGQAIAKALDKVASQIGTGTHRALPTSARSYFRAAMREVLHLFPDPDWSRADWAVVCRMLKRGYEPEEVVHALVEESPDLAGRKGAGYVHGYAQLTTRNAFSAVFGKELEETSPDPAGDPS